MSAVAQVSITPPSAVVFDFDGVIADTEPVHYAAFQQVLAPLGLSFSWSQYEQDLIGFDDRGVFREVFHRAGRTLSPEEEASLIAAKGRAFSDCIRSEAGNALQPLPGVTDWLRKLAGRVPLALCTGALPSDIESLLNRFGFDRYFDVRVTAADTAVSKPDPAPYRLVLARLRQRFPDRAWTPGHVVAIEDSVAGVASARGAGLRVVRIVRGANESRDPWVWTVPSLDRLSLQAVEAWCCA